MVHCDWFHSDVANRAQMCTTEHGIPRHLNRGLPQRKKENNCTSDCHEENYRITDCHSQVSKFESVLPRGYSCCGKLRYTWERFAKGLFLLWQITVMEHFDSTEKFATYLITFFVKLSWKQINSSTREFNTASILYTKNLPKTRWRFYPFVINKNGLHLIRLRGKWWSAWCLARPRYLAHSDPKVVSPPLWICTHPDGSEIFQIMLNLHSYM
jgi:hypothetical protein